MAARLLSVVAVAHAARAADGFSLIETLVATALLATAVAALAQLSGLAARSNTSSRNTTYAALLASQKLEQLRSLAWRFDEQGLPVSDLTTDTTVSPESPEGGTGLSPSPDTALLNNTPGWVDYLDRSGRNLGGGARPPAGAVYVRRWSIQPLPENPDHALIVQVLVTRDAAGGEGRARRRRPEEARFVTLRTRRGP